MENLKRRTFFKWGLAGAALSFLKPAQASQLIEEVSENSQRRLAVQPIVVSTWSHGLAANAEAWKVIGSNGTSFDAVEQGVRVTESDLTNRSVGIGGLPDSAGHVTLDACIMNEHSECGSVACLEGIDHPISVARAVLEKTPHVMLVGAGARAFALDQGFAKIKTPIKEAKDAWKEWKKEEKRERPQINHENHDTIGMLALDQFGNLSGACTTSGWAYKIPGRVGDSPIIGAGLFVDNEIGAACATGMGEAVIRIAGSHTVVELMRQGHSPQRACELAVDRIVQKHKDLTNLQVGFIALDRSGNYGAFSVYAGFNVAVNREEKGNLVDAGYLMEW